MPIAQIAFICAGVLTLLVAITGMRVVSQSENHVVKQFGKYTKTLKAGLHFIIPLFDKATNRVSALERHCQKNHTMLLPKTTSLQMSQALFSLKSLMLLR